MNSSSQPRSLLISEELANIGTKLPFKIRALTAASGTERTFIFNMD
jgi:hypothetical protein